MACYIVTFEINSEATKTVLHERLQKYGSYCPIHEYCWAVISAQSAEQVRNYLMEALTGGDRIFVIRSGTEAAWSNTYGEDNSKWLKNNL